MIDLKIKLEKEIILKAHEHENLRNDCKDYLSKAGKNYDKFTMVSHDTFIGYITEWAIKNYIQKCGKDKEIEVTSWDDDYDIAKIKAIIKSNSVETKDIDYVQKYFYDEYDLKLFSPKNTILIDIKTALTDKEPNNHWDFMYPVVQAQKPGKDYMVLTYYVTMTKNNPEDFKKITLIGYISEETIRSCKIIKKGEKTRHGTISQIDNYETELALHYRDIKELIEMF